ncbi:lyase [Catellatospora sp. TT07R-123]|uniref:VOC family protein n=1 Tax=Catellatospora sp. TT07R-123 TaxID=2733863 RepID=UPI001B1EE98A|nr:VOC family protein [Catellatospora sp. TT07R-123]GHJ50053.1 lyase [Catellatospora sp. TT07R-123]
MDFRVSHCFILVDDHEKALGFYRDALGCAVRNDVRFEGMRWVTVVPPGQPELEITIETVDSYPGTSPEDKQKLSELLAKGLLRGLIFMTEDVDAAFERIRATGAEVVQEPMDQAYGVRDCAFRDPAGNMIRINQPAKYPPGRG